MELANPEAFSRDKELLVWIASTREATAPSGKAWTHGREGLQPGGGRWGIATRAVWAVIQEREKGDMPGPQRGHLSMKDYML